MSVLFKTFVLNLLIKTDLKGIDSSSCFFFFLIIFQNVKNSFMIFEKINSEEYLWFENLKQEIAVAILELHIKVINDWVLLWNTCYSLEVTVLGSLVYMYLIKRVLNAKRNL